MRYAYRRPTGLLANFVELLWFFEGYAKPHAKERLLPDGSMELVINLGEDAIRIWDRRDVTRHERLEGAAMVGAQSEYFVIDTAQQSSVIGVHFRPGGAFPFLSLPADELHGLHVSLSDLWGGFARELRERLLGVPDPEIRFDILETALRSRMVAPQGHHPAVRFALGEFHGVWRRRVGEVTGDTGLSSRRFIDLFRRQVGLPPKLYCRVLRFQSIVRRLPLGQSIDWAGTAVDAGYCDQAHLVHDFRSLAGISPGTWAALRTDHTNHVPLADPVPLAE